MKKITGRSWAFVMYPDSMPTNWQEIIQQSGLPIAISPLHDKDTDPTGEIKKPHYHCICYYENPTTFNSVKSNICDKLNATIPQKLESLRGMYRYHLHLDNPEKYQYSDTDRQFFNGFDIGQCNKLTHTETFKIILQIFDFCFDNNINEYSDLIKILKDNDLIQMLEVATFNTIVFRTFLDSRRNKIKDLQKTIDK